MYGHGILHLRQAIYRGISPLHIAGARPLLEVHQAQLGLIPLLLPG